MLLYLFSRLELSFPVPELLGVGLVELLELQRFVLHQHLALFVLKLLQLLDGRASRRPRLLQLSVMLGLKALVLRPVTLLLRFLELNISKCHEKFVKLKKVLVFCLPFSTDLFPRSVS